MIRPSLQVSALLAALIAAFFGGRKSVTVSPEMVLLEVPPEVITVGVYVAARDIDINERMTSESVRLERRPLKEVPPNAITEFQTEEVLGENKFARTRVHVGQVITNKQLKDNLINRQGGFKQGWRVYTIERPVIKLAPGPHVSVRGRTANGKTVPVLYHARVFAINTEDGATSLVVKEKDVIAIATAITSEEIEQFELSPLPSPSCEHCKDQ